MSVNRKGIQMCSAPESPVTDHRWLSSVTDHGVESNNPKFFRYDFAEFVLTLYGGLGRIMTQYMDYIYLEKAAIGMDDCPKFEERRKRVWQRENSKRRC